MHRILSNDAGRWPTTAMVHLRWCLLIVISAVGSSTARAQTLPAALITSPSEGAVVQGPVEIRGTAEAAQFKTAEIAFSYDDDPSQTWFLIADVQQPILDGILTVWQTTSISDGAYALRLRVSSTDGLIQEAIVHLEVRNYTRPSRGPTQPAVTPTQPRRVETPIVLLATATLLLPPPRTTPTALPPNPSALNPEAVVGGLARGGIAALATLLLVGVLLLRRRE